MEHTNRYPCPVCEATTAKHFLTVKDHFLSKEDFDLLECDTCALVYTTPRPGEAVIGSYYQSEDYVSHSSSKKGLINSVYNQVRNYTLGKKVKLIRAVSKGNTLLDVGAGTGHFLKRAQEAGFVVKGLEPDPGARKVAFEQNQVDLRPLEELKSVGENSVDLITMWHVMEHVYDLRQDATKMASLIKSGGAWIIAVPNHKSFDAVYYKDYWAAYDVPRHLYHFSPATIVPFIEQLGFVLEKQLPMKFDAYYVSMLSEKYKGGSILNAMRIGWLSNLRAGRDRSSSQIYVFRKK